LMTFAQLSLGKGVGAGKIHRHNPDLGGLGDFKGHAGRSGAFIGIGDAGISPWSPCSRTSRTRFRVPARRLKSFRSSIGSPGLEVTFFSSFALEKEFGVALESNPREPEFALEDVGEDHSVFILARADADVVEKAGRGRD